MSTLETTHRNRGGRNKISEARSARSSQPEKTKNSSKTGGEANRGDGQAKTADSQESSNLGKLGQHGADIEAIEGVHNNIQFLILEVSAMLRDVSNIVEGRTDRSASIFAREDYINNLKSVIENKVYTILASGCEESSTVDFLRAVNIVAANLERIADFAVDIVRQIRHLKKSEVVLRYGPESFFREICGHLELVEEGLWNRKVGVALQLCRCEVRVDHLYEKSLKRIVADLRGGFEPEDLVTTTFIYRYLERMADSLLNIGEAIILAVMHERIKISHYEALESTFAAANIDIDMETLAYEGIWETRSGSIIGTVHERGGSDANWAIFKEGQTKKLVEERDGIHCWEHHAAGVPPRIIEFQSQGDHSSMLLEFIRGETFQNILVDGSVGDLHQATEVFFELLGSVWQNTMVFEPAKSRFVSQIQKRLPEIRKTHPLYFSQAMRMGALREDKFEHLLELVGGCDDVLECPFSVLLHGDLNIDNVMICQRERRARLIDLHRARHGDYVQDASVFLLSNVRLPLHGTKQRSRLEWVCQQSLRFVEKFAHRHQDETWQARLAFGVARSFVTSTRFELNTNLAASMFGRAHFLVRSLIAWKGRPWGDYQLPATIFQL